ncbi:MAG: hypothetical protein ACYDAY_07845 [Candidatus Dormibacteria bacterium]
MPNLFTRVPPGPVPRLPPAARPVVLLADLFMWAMASRPSTGSLADTWVTPGTLLLCVLVVPVGVLLSGLLLGGSGPARVAGALLVLVTTGAVAVALVALLQRRER